MDFVLTYRFSKSKEVSKDPTLEWVSASKPSDATACEEKNSEEAPVKGSKPDIVNELILIKSWHSSLIQYESAIQNWLLHSANMDEEGLSAQVFLSFQRSRESQGGAVQELIYANVLCLQLKKFEDFEAAFEAFMESVETMKWQCTLPLELARETKFNIDNACKCKMSCTIVTREIRGKLHAIRAA
ncbi:hypothetical protein ABW21_db0206796 [Orbilia brochopaga]|nr:hypothetical protein ABW21_db0206796 [Drechslerella brochopaga]